MEDYRQNLKAALRRKARRVMIKKLQKLCSSFFPVVAFCMVISNFALSCSAVRSIKPQVVIHNSEVTNYVYTVTSNVYSSSDISTNAIRAVSAPIPPREFTATYDYFVNAGSPCVRIYGKLCFEGDVVSYGRIFRIFPDRIFLMNGDIIINQKFVGGRGFDNEGYERKRGLRND